MGDQGREAGTESRLTEPLALRIRNTEPISPAMQNPGRRTGPEAHDA
jgi:hypothetical protein